jgi:hypothetical protein
MWPWGRRRVDPTGCVGDGAPLGLSRSSPRCVAGRGPGTRRCPLRHPLDPGSAWGRIECRCNQSQGCGRQETQLMGLRGQRPGRLSRAAPARTPENADQHLQGRRQRPGAADGFQDRSRSAIQVPGDGRRDRHRRDGDWKTMDRASGCRQGSRQGPLQGDLELIVVSRRRPERLLGGSPGRYPAMDLKTSLPMLPSRPVRADDSRLSDPARCRRRSRPDGRPVPPGGFADPRCRYEGDDGSGRPVRRSQGADHRGRPGPRGSGW